MSNFKTKPCIKVNSKLNFIKKKLGITRGIFAEDFFGFSRVTLSLKSNGRIPWKQSEMYKFIDMINGLVRDQYPEEVIEYDELHLYFTKEDILKTL